MCNGKNECAEEDSPVHRHRTQKTGKDKTTKKNLFTERSHQNAGKQCSIGGKWSGPALLQESLIVRLYLYMELTIQVANSQAIQNIQSQNTEKKHNHQE